MRRLIRNSRSVSMHGNIDDNISPFIRRRTSMLLLPLSLIAIALLPQWIMSPKLIHGYSISHGVPASYNRLWSGSTRLERIHRHQQTMLQISESNENEEAQRLLDKVKQMRMEIAALTGQTIEDVEREAAMKKESITKQNEERALTSLQRRNNETFQQQQRQYIVPVPETVAEQIQQAANAIERAYNDGYVQKQIVRFAFVPIVTGNNNDEQLCQQVTEFVRNDQDWPGGIQQIYREAAKPFTYQLLQQLRIKNTIHTNNNNEYKNKPTIQEQTLWDFDGSAIITASTSSSTSPTVGDADRDESTVIQALIHPNTDNRYFNDIIQMDQQLVTARSTRTDDSLVGEAVTGVETERNGRVNLIINPFWTNATSWGYNIFAPKAQQRANEIIFMNDNNGNGNNNKGYIETYSMITKTVRGEDCIAIRAYPYDWQLYAYIEMNEGRWSSPYMTTIHLGSTTVEPAITDFVSYMSNRTEFQYSKNMRQMQRTLNQK